MYDRRHRWLPAELARSWDAPVVLHPGGRATNVQHRSVKHGHEREARSKRLLQKPKPTFPLLRVMRILTRKEPGTCREAALTVGSDPGRSQRWAYGLRFYCPAVPEAQSGSSIHR
jgi:hypothetical protein